MAGIDATKLSEVVQLSTTAIERLENQSAKANIKLNQAFDSLDEVYVQIKTLQIK